MILVTGGTGLVGSYLLRDLVLSGRQVRALRRPASDFRFMKMVFEYYHPGKNLESLIEWVEGDVLDIFSLEDALEGVEEVYHCAAIVSFHPGDIRRMMQTNVNGTANLVNACLSKQIRKLCHVSSIAALGNSELGRPIDENNLWKASRNNSQYAVSKYGGEREVWRGMEEGLEAVIVNPSFILGPGNREKDNTGIFQAVWKGLPFYSMGINGFVDIRDVAKAMQLLMQGGTSRERFVVTSENLSYRDLFCMIADRFGKRRPFLNTAPWMAEIYWRFESLAGFLARKKPALTRETARSANHRCEYSNEKIRKTTGMDFIPVRDCLDHMCRFFLEVHAH